MTDTLNDLAKKLTLKVGEDAQQSAVDRGKLIVFAAPERGAEVRGALESLTKNTNSYELYEGEFHAVEGLAPVVPSGLVAAQTVFATPGDRIEPAGGRAGVLSCVVKHQDGSLLGLTVEHLFRARNGEAVSNSVGRLGAHRDNGRLGADGKARADCAVFSLDAEVLPSNGPFPAHVGAGKLKNTENQMVVRHDNPLQEARVVRVDFQARYKVDVLQNVNGAPTVVRKKVALEDQILIRDDSQSFAINRDSGVLIVMRDAGPNGAFVAGAPLAICTSLFDNGLFYTASPISACLKLLNLSGIA